MNAFQTIGVSVLGQVTAITVLAGVMALMLGRRRAAARHAVGVTALGLVLVSPVVSLLLPQGTWWPSSSERTPSTSGAAANGDASRWMLADHGSEQSRSLPHKADEDDVAGTETRELVASRNEARNVESSQSSWWLALRFSVCARVVGRRVGQGRFDRRPTSDWTKITRRFPGEDVDFLANRIGGPVPKRLVPPYGAGRRARGRFERHAKRPSPGPAATLATMNKSWQNASRSVPC